MDQILFLSFEKGEKNAKINIFIFGHASVLWFVQQKTNWWLTMFFKFIEKLFQNFFKPW